jgi:hypothetical protein
MNETHETETTPSPTPASAPLGAATSDLPTVDALLGLVREPLLAAARGRARRDALAGRRVRIVARASLGVPEHAVIVRGGEVLTQGRWPATRGALQAGDHVVVQVGTEPADRERYVRWLHELAASEPPPMSLAPCSQTAAGLHPLWCIAAARLCLPAHVAVEARHDLLGIRLAQVALGFGADALGGPIETDRSLPLCGVTRPDENTAAGLATLVRHAGLQPVHAPESTP